MPPYVYRVTKYDPVDRDEHGHDTGFEDSDRGQAEDACRQAVEVFATDTGIDHLAVREPQVASLAHFGAERPWGDFGLDGLFPSGLTGFHDGAEVPLAVRLERCGSCCATAAPDVGWRRRVQPGWFAGSGVGLVASAGRQINVVAKDLWITRRPCPRVHSNS
ncbi:hypothetical protein ABZ826_05710 [Streptomyces sp. NPDC047515]|uniref:hypothetical protein n=1 Tax=Streptomyces sp. NPDC047515 TaxID=3155380 RepID=UPI0033F40553